MVRTFGYILILFHACSFSTKPILIITLSSIVAHFRAKMSLSRAQNIFMPANINSIVILEQINY